MSAADFLNSIGKLEDVHPVCLLCKKSCKKQYSFWSFQVSPSEFCSDFVEDGELRRKLDCYESEFKECMEDLKYLAEKGLLKILCDLHSIFKCKLAGKRGDEQ